MVSPWYSTAEPKALYENEKARAYWDVPLYAESTEVWCNRIDARLVSQGGEENCFVRDELPMDFK